MGQILDYASHAPTPHSRLVCISANMTLLYPFWIVIVLYGEWLVAWLVLGHPPEPSLDDPLHIHSANWIHGVTGVSLVSAIPVMIVALALNLLVIIRQSFVGRGIVRLLAVLVLWSALFVLLRWDPGAVVDWWMD